VAHALERVERAAAQQCLEHIYHSIISIWLKKRKISEANFASVIM
jgi:hypothetical protein